MHTEMLENALHIAFLFSARNGWLKNSAAIDNHSDTKEHPTVTRERQTEWNSVAGVSVKQMSQKIL